MKKTLKILLYFSVILLIVILSISKESTKQDEVMKVIIEQESNTSEKIEKVKEIQKQINQTLTVNAGDDQNITFREEVRMDAVAKDTEGKT